jgi:HK97 family phage prohead protease
MSDQQRETRDCVFPFALERAGDAGGDGLDFSGYAAVFNSPTAIRDQDGEYTETIAPGAFKRSIASKPPVLMFNHGKSAPIGEIPIGKITDIREDPRGLFVQARLLESLDHPGQASPLVATIRDAIAADAINGMSFRFEVIKDDWLGRGSKRTRTLREVRVPEVGPVVFPAYANTTASVRSTIQAFAEQYPDLVHVEIRGARDDDEDMGVQDLVTDAIESLWGLSLDAKLIDFFDDHALFITDGLDQAKYPGLWQVNYNHQDGQVTIGEPSRPPIAGYMQSANDPAQANNITNPAYNSAPVEGEEREDDDRAAADINDLPDSAFAYIEPGGTKDASGKTAPRSLRHFPIHDAAHVRNALARASQSPFGKEAMPKIMAAAKKMGIGMADQTNSQDLSTSDELATEGTSEEPAARATKPTREQIIREIQLRERGILLPKGA